MTTDDDQPGLVPGFLLAACGVKLDGLVMIVSAGLMPEGFCSGPEQMLSNGLSNAVFLIRLRARPLAVCEPS